MTKHYVRDNGANDWQYPYENALTDLLPPRQSKATRHTIGYVALVQHQYGYGLGWLRFGIHGRLQANAPGVAQGAWSIAARAICRTTAGC